MFRSSRYSSRTTLLFWLNDQVKPCRGPPMANGLLLTGQIRCKEVKENPTGQFKRSSDGCCISWNCCVYRCGQADDIEIDGQHCQLPPNVIKIVFANSRCDPLKYFDRVSQLVQYIVAWWAAMCMQRTRHHKAITETMLDELLWRLRRPCDSRLLVEVHLANLDLQFE